MLEEKQRQFWNLHLISILHKVTQSDFQFSSYFFYFFPLKPVFSKMCFVGTLTCKKLQKLKIALCSFVFVSNSMQIQKLSLFFF